MHSAARPNLARDDFALLLRRSMSALIFALVATASACSTDGLLAPQPCPNLSTTAGNLYAFGDNLLIDGDLVESELPTHPTTGFTLFAGHAIAVPAAGGLSLTVSGTVHRTGAPPVLYLYGPRDDEGVFGTCASQFGTGKGGRHASLTFDVPEGGGGEFLILIGTNPIARGGGGYSVSATCAGEGCGGLACEPLADCATEVCSTGFVTQGHPDDGHLRCPTCECRGQECAGGQKLVHNECVCDCPASLDQKPVCGADGVTYASKCLAQCREAQVAFEGKCAAGCEPLVGCDLDLAACPFGPVLTGGCPSCGCAGECDKQDAVYRPVCGMDGLTYNNAQQLRCTTGAADPGVLSQGPCLPFCQAPSGCQLTCEHGFLPAAGVGTGCFECACMANPANDAECGAGKPQWCAKQPLSALEGLTLDQLLASYRTFVSDCSASEASWAPVLNWTCPAGVCANDASCEQAATVLDSTLSRIGTPPLKPLKVDCVSPGFSGVPLCLFKTKRFCKLDGAADQCPAGATCKDTQSGPRCEFACTCLNGSIGAVYDPVCVDVDGQDTTVYNPCMAFCSGTWPPKYPGTCCAERLTLDQRHQRIADIDVVCKAHGADFSARLFVETACPPTVETCEADPEGCCYDKVVASGGPQGGGGPP